MLAKQHWLELYPEDRVVRWKTSLGYMYALQKFFPGSKTNWPKPAEQSKLSFFLSNLIRKIKRCVILFGSLSLNNIEYLSIDYFWWYLFDIPMKTDTVNFCDEFICSLKLKMNGKTLIEKDLVKIWIHRLPSILLFHQ